MLVQGCDVWLNTPRRPHEASGHERREGPRSTAGVNVSILDGWWVEGYRGDNGWAIGDMRVDPDNAAQDAEDAESLYRILEEEVVPRFFDARAEGPAPAPGSRP